MADCFFHTGRPSVARCRQCGKPVCAECRTVTADGVYCGAECAAKGAGFARRSEEMDARPKTASGLVWTLLRAALAVAVLLVAWRLAGPFLRR